MKRSIRLWLAAFGYACTVGLVAAHASDVVLWASLAAHGIGTPVHEGRLWLVLTVAYQTVSGRYLVLRGLTTTKRAVRL